MQREQHWACKKSTSIYSDFLAGTGRVLPKCKDNETSQTIKEGWGEVGRNDKDE